MKWWLIPAGVTVGGLIWVVADWQDPAHFGVLANALRFGFWALASTVSWGIYAVARFIWGIK